MPAISPADTAWMLIATAMVLVMTPALGFFYGGMVRAKNALNTMMMSYVALGFVGIAWALIGYSLAFSEGGGLLGDLRFGWFGFNAGSALGASTSAALAFGNTMFAPMATLVVWSLLDLMRTRKTTAIGAATAIVVGLVAITPAAGFISPLSAIALGGIAAPASYFSLMWRARTRRDDSLVIAAASGAGGSVGSLLTGILGEQSGNCVA